MKGKIKRFSKNRFTLCKTISFPRMINMIDLSLQVVGLQLSIENNVRNIPITHTLG